MKEFYALKLEVHGVLAGLSIHDVTWVDLPSNGIPRTLADLRALFAPGSLERSSVAARILFDLRFKLGRWFGWDDQGNRTNASSYQHRLSDELRGRSQVPSGTPDGPFRLLYLLEHESLAEIQNATVHAFLASVLCPTAAGYRLYWAVYVLPVSRLTPFYMALIDPFRRLIVYPAIFRRLAKEWRSHYS